MNLRVGQDIFESDLREVPHTLPKAKVFRGAGTLMMELDFCTRMQRARAEQTEWVKLAVRARCDALSVLRGHVAARMQDIVDVLSSETGKTPLDALSGDVMVTLEQLRFNEKHASHILSTRGIGKPPLVFSGARFEETREPFGVVLIYSPANYPFQLSVVPMATALVAGNAVILKCSDRTPRTAQLISELCRSANLPENLVQVICDPPESASALVDAGPDLVFFTGSSGNGCQIAMRCAERLIPAVLELGGKDPCLVFADCNFKRTVEGVAYGAFSNAGQVCVGIKRLYVEGSIFSPFLDALAARARQLNIGSARDSDLGVLPSGIARARFLMQVEDALQRGATLHLPRRNKLTGCEPVILSDVSANARLVTEEVFGPVLFAAPFAGESEAVAFANASAFALSCSIWTGDPVRGKRIAAQMTAGTCAVNDVIRNIANPHASFGGNRQSGHGRYHGPHGLLAFSRPKSVMTVRDRSTRERHWFPYTKQTFQLLRSVIILRHSKGSIFRRVRQVFLPALLLALLLSSLHLNAEHVESETCRNHPRGPWGMSTAIMLGQAGFRVTFLEKNERVGGRQNCLL